MWCWVHLWLWSAPCAMVWLECQVQLLRPQSCRLGSSVKRPSGIQPMVSCKEFFGASHVFRTSTVVLTFHAWKKHRQVASPASKTLIFYNRCLEHLNLDFADKLLPWPRFCWWSLEMCAKISCWSYLQKKTNINQINPDSLYNLYLYHLYLYLLDENSSRFRFRLQPGRFGQVLGSGAQSLGMRGGVPWVAVFGGDFNSNELAISSENHRKITGKP